MASGSEFLVCSCYFTSNIFLHNYRLHVTYQSEEQFLEDHREVRRQLAPWVIYTVGMILHVTSSVAGKEWVQREGTTGTRVE
jgi:hypothetical protein